MKEWAWIDGQFLRSTGRSLASCNSREMFNIAYSHIMDQASVTKEEMEARDTIKAWFRDIEFEATTGMPAITQWMQPANEMYGPE